MAQIQPPTLTLDPKLINFYAEVLHEMYRDHWVTSDVQFSKGAWIPPFLGGQWLTWFIDIYGVYTVFLGRKITIQTVIYGVYIRFWPSLRIWNAYSNPTMFMEAMVARGARHFVWNNSNSCTAEYNGSAWRTPFCLEQRQFLHRRI